MSALPESVAEFLSHKHIAVAGVSRDSAQPANLIYRKLRDAGYQVYAINPNANELEGDPCYPNLQSVPAAVEGVMIATHPDVAPGIVRDCAERGVDHVWFHRSFGEGSVSEEAVRECERKGITAIVGGCPMMYVGPVDFGHKCMRWVLGIQGKVPR